MKNICGLPKDFLILLAIIVIACVFSITMTSCGARKVEKSKKTTTEVATKIDSSKTTTQIDTNVKIVDVSQTDEIIYTPVDTSKVMIVNNRQFKNVQIRHKKVKNNITTDKTIIASQIKQNDIKTAIVKTKVIEQKVAERESVVKWWWWLLFILLLSAGYFTYRFYKKQSPF
jgi:flagellar biosynthesis component FlhA